MLQRFVDDFRNGQLTVPDLLSHIRPFYHSLRGTTREEVVGILGMLPDTEASRELVLLFRHSLWRSTRLQIVQALAKHPTQRGLEFLMRLATDTHDLAMSERALWSLGGARQLFASRFLVHLYERCPETLAPKVAAALGNALDPALSARFLQDLETALAAGKLHWARNLALALAEFKEHRVVPHLRAMAQTPHEALLAQSALLALGKVARDLALVSDLEERFQSDFFSFQLFTSVRNQVQFRAQWKLEDYLLKLFEAREIHPALPLELNGFEAAEVREGLMLFREDRHVPRLALALARIRFPEVARWYEEFFPLASLDSFKLTSLLKSLRFHHGEQVRPLLENTRDSALTHDEDTVADAWCEAVSLSQPRSEELFEPLPDLLPNLSDTRRIMVLNHVTNSALMADAKRLKHFVKLIETCYLKWPGVRGRALRSLGQLETVGNKTLPIVRESLTQENLVSSCLFLLEKSPSKQGTELLGEVPAGDASRRVALLKAWATQEQVPKNALPGYLALVKRSLEDVSAIVPRTEALLTIAAHPHPDFVPLVAACLKDESVRLPAILAAKALGTEDLVDALGECLASPSESVVGRAVDTLTHLPGARAKRLVLDFLLKHPLDTDLCDKVIRCLQAPQGATDFFTQKLDELLRAHPLHPMREGLVRLRDSFAAKTHEHRSLGEATAPEIAAVDAEIAQRIAGYARFDDDVKAALRAAEIPFHRPEMFRGVVDKSTTIIAYSKAIDLILESQLGRRLLFPRLESMVHEFQNVLHAVGLDDPATGSTRLLENLGLEACFASESLPMHKMALVSQGILTGKILSEHWKVVDGLKAWAVILLLFARAPLPALPQRKKPLLDLGSPQEAIIDFSKRLIALQELRNPAAHRETWLRFPELDDVRTNVTELLKRWQRLADGAGK